MMQTPIPQPQNQSDQPTVQPGEPFIYYQPQSIPQPTPQPIASPDPPISWKPLYLVFAGAVISGCLLWLQQVGQRRTVEALPRPQPTPALQPPTAQPSPIAQPSLYLPPPPVADPVNTPQPQPAVQLPQVSQAPAPSVASLPVITPNGVTVCPGGSGTCGIRLRTSPSLGSAVYTALPSDVPVQRIGPVQTDNQGITWTYVNVDYNSQVYTGWIASNLLR